MKEKRKYEKKSGKWKKGEEAVVEPVVEVKDVDVKTGVEVVEEKEEMIDLSTCNHPKVERVLKRGYYYPRVFVDKCVLCGEEKG